MEQFRKKDLNVLAISYDPVTVLKAFSEKHQITYPLLSDENSEVIKRFGIFNSEIDSSSRGFGIPYPGIYIIDENLKVTDKHFEQSYRERPTAQNVLITLLDEKLETNVQTFKTNYLAGSIGISDSIAYRAQLLTIVVEINLKEGFHLYSKPIPDGFIPLDIEFEPNPNFEIDEFVFPESKKLTIESLNETFNILSGKISLKTFLRIKNRPEIGNYTVKATMTFQACTDEVCLVPEKYKYDFPLRIASERL